VYYFVPINLATNKPGKPIKISGPAVGIAITPDGKTAYVTGYSSGTVTPIDLATNTAAKPIKVSDKPGAMAIAITPDGTTAYVASGAFPGGKTASAANGAFSTVTPIDLATNTPGKPIKIGHAWDSGFEAIVIAP